MDRCAIMVSAIAALLLVASPARARSGAVALTFDDLPALSILPDQRYVDYLTSTLLRKLVRARAPAIGFVNESKLALDRPAEIADLRRWRDAGMGLGNHTFSHAMASQVGAKAYIADIVAGEPVTRALLAEKGLPLRWFRHPYLDTGSPAPVRRAIDFWLAGHGYRVAPVTIDADDWEFAEPYDDAIARHDAARQKRIRREYLAFTSIRIGWSQAGARALFGRDIAHVMLLHATRLNADTIDRLVKLLRRAHLRTVSLETAMRDPVYRTPDDYAGKDGINWLERWSLTLHKDLPSAGDIDPPADIQRAYDRVDNDRTP